MTEPIIAARVHPEEEHHCGGTIREARGQYGRFLGCSNDECQTAWDANGWRFTGKRELYDHGNYGLPDQFEPVMHPGDWRHHAPGHVKILADMDDVSALDAAVRFVLFALTFG